jgi:ATP synthase protein I
MTARESSTVVKILSYQFLIIAIVTIGFVVVKGKQAGFFSALGGGAAFIPNVYFAIRVQQAIGKEARKIVNAFYVGESGKLVLTAILFALIFQMPNIQLLPLLMGYITALSVFWLALLMR